MYIPPLDQLNIRGLTAILEPKKHREQSNYSEKKGGEGGTNVRDNDSDVPWYSTNLAHKNQASVLSIIYTQKILRTGRRDGENKREKGGKRDMERDRDMKRSRKQRSRDRKNISKGEWITSG